MNEINNSSNKYFVLAFILLVFLIEGVLFYVGNQKENQRILNEEKRIETLGSKLEQVPVLAQAFSVYDMALQKEIYGKNQNEPLPIASLAKTIGVIVALNAYESDDVISISEKAVRQAGDSGLFVNEKWNVEDLAKITLIASLNDGIFAFEEQGEDLIKIMNEKAQKIGMENSIFFNTTGLDIDKDMAGAYASALDANLMASFAYQSYPEIFNATIFPEMKITSVSGFEHTIKNTDIILDKIPNILFSKTGYTALAGGNLTIIFKNKDSHDIVITVLGSTFNGRFSDMENLVRALYN